MSSLPPTNVRVFRTVAAAWLLGWFWKAPFFVGYYFDEIWAHPLRYDGLPRVLVHPALAALAWASPILVIATLAYPRPWTLRAASGLMAAASLVACVHFEMFSDATFVTSLWVALWLVWFAGNARRSDAALYLHGRVLAQCALALVFLGGAVGKLTPEYWSGEALHQLYIVQKESWPYPWLRDAVPPEQLRVLATWFSRAVIVIELGLVASPLLPYRVVALGGTAIMAGMVAVSTLHLFSVMACLCGLLLAQLLARDDYGDGASSRGGITAPSRGR